MVLVTGPTGFVGRRVVAALNAGGHPVRALVHGENPASVLSGLDVEIVRGDLLDVESLRKACDGIDGVIHLVAVVRERGDLTYRRVNYEGTRNVLEAASSSGAKRFIQANTVGATSDPGLPYLHSRWMAEEEVARSHTSHKVVRFSVGFGDGDEFLNVLAALVKLSPLIPIAGDGKTKFQPISVEDIARCLVTAYESDDEATVEVGGPEVLSYEEMVDIVAATLGVRIAKVHVPVPLMRPVVAVAEALSPRPIITRDQLSMVEIDNTAELDSVEKAFGFAPRPLRGNIDYIRKISLRDALRINLGLMPDHIRDH